MNPPIFIFFLIWVLLFSWLSALVFLIGVPPVSYFGCSLCLVRVPPFCYFVFAHGSFFWVTSRSFLFFLFLSGPGGALPRPLGSRARSAACIHPGVPPQSHRLRALGKPRKKKVETRRNDRGIVQTQPVHPPLFFVLSVVLCGHGLHSGNEAVYSDNNNEKNKS